MSNSTGNYVNLLDRLIEAGGYELPAGCDMWAIRSVRPDLRSSRGYRWPFPGNWAEAPGPIIESNMSPCPGDVGDGLCVADSWQGMVSGGIPARTLLLCAIRSRDLLPKFIGGEARARRVFVVDLIDGETLVIKHGQGANLQGANLQGADLWRADLQGADLLGAYLWGADLWGADLQGAVHNKATTWPEGFDPEKAGAVLS